jgi:hypothetical protein
MPFNSLCTARSEYPAVSAKWAEVPRDSLRCRAGDRNLDPVGQVDRGKAIRRRLRRDSFCAYAAMEIN